MEIWEREEGATREGVARVALAPGWVWGTGWNEGRGVGATAGWTCWKYTGAEPPVPRPARNPHLLRRGGVFFYY